MIKPNKLSIYECPKCKARTGGDAASVVKGPVEGTVMKEVKPGVVQK